MRAIRRKKETAWRTVSQLLRKGCRRGERGRDVNASLCLVRCSQRGQYGLKIGCGGDVQIVTRTGVLCPDQGSGQEGEEDSDARSRSAE